MGKLKKQFINRGWFGQGIAGKVYKGILSNGCHVAIKHIIKDGHAETFVREVTSLSHVRHPNLVVLRGYYNEQDECFLVYEMRVNGNLSEWIFGKVKTLTWIPRLEISVGSARGLWFLHTYPGGCIVHCDVKVTYQFFHWKKGTPFAEDQGIYKNLTWWEQMDNGKQLTRNRKFLTVVPVVLYLIASHTTDYRHPMLFLNTVAAVILVVAKLPNMHKVRIFGINSDR